MPGARHTGGFCQFRDDLEQLHFRARAQGPIEPFKGGGLLRRIAGRHAQPKSGVIDFDPVETAHRLLQFEPPEPGAALDHPGGEENGKRRAMPLQDRQGEIAHVAIAVVEGQSYEGRPAGRPQPGDGLQEGHDLEPLRFQEPN